MTKQNESREAYQVVSDLWDKLKSKYPDMKIPLRLVDVKAGLKTGTCSAILYGKVSESIHTKALLQCERAIK